MSTSSPWTSLFQTHVKHLHPATFTLSTLHLLPTSTTPYAPRARTCIYRSALPHPSSPNPSSQAASDLLTFTTDARSEKVGDILGISRPEGGKGEVGGSGGGGGVEAVFWIEEVQTQWRFRGDGWVLGWDVGGESEGAREVRRVLGARVGGGGDGWRWEGEVEAQWGRMSEMLRKGFRGPPPGGVRGEGEEGEGEGGGDEEGKGNFRVVAIRPMEVECVDLMDPENAKRWLYRFMEGKGEWEREELWP